MDDLCVHCGEPIQYVPNFYGVPMWLHNTGLALCGGGFGHQACPAQSGFE